MFPAGDDTGCLLRRGGTSRSSAVSLPSCYVFMLPIELVLSASAPGFFASALGTLAHPRAWPEPEKGDQAGRSVPVLPYRNS